MSTYVQPYASYLPANNTYGQSYFNNYGSINNYSSYSAPSTSIFNNYYSAPQVQSFPPVTAFPGAITGQPVQQQQQGGFDMNGMMMMLMMALMVNKLQNNNNNNNQTTTETVETNPDGTTTTETVDAGPANDSPSSSGSSSSGTLNPLKLAKNSISRTFDDVKNGWKEGGKSVPVLGNIVGGIAGLAKASIMNPIQTLGDVLGGIF